MNPVPFLTPHRLLQPLAWREDHGFTFTSRLEPGLYTVGLQADLKDFAWESVWLPMTLYGNKGQRTGPWDFDLYHENVPLLPTWKIHRNGRYVGLFHLQRPTVEDLAARTLRGEFGFRVDRPEDVTLEAAPLNAFQLEPLSLYLEPNAFDRLVPQAWADRGLAANWARHVEWGGLRRKIAGTEWEAWLRKAVQFYRESYRPGPTPGTAPVTVPAEALPVFLFAYRLLDDKEAREDALGVVRHWLGKPAWGNPNPLGYGHNGDMGCATVMKNLALALNGLEAELGDLRAPLLERLDRQLEIFVEQQLLMAQYWGGATLQDHGFRSSACAATAALHLLGHTETAREALAFYIPRLYRTFDKLPADGFIPFSSYHSINLYTNDMTEFRSAFRFASGRDIFREVEAYRNVPDYLLSGLDDETLGRQICSPRGDVETFRWGGLPFLLAMGAEHASARYMAHLILTAHRDTLKRMPEGDGKATPSRRIPPLSVPFAILEFAPDRVQPARPEKHALACFPDGGALQYRSPAGRFHAAVMCPANTASFRAAGRDLSGTDMGMCNPSAGGFTVSVRGRPLLQTGESGYRTASRLSNVLLIDGKGQYGDIGYTMGVPMRVWRGQRIQACAQDPDGARGWARLNLAPAYPDELEVLTYTRDFHFEPDRVRVRDTVITRQPHRFGYAFNTYARHRLERLADNCYRFAHADGALTLTVVGEGWTLAKGETEIVWGYVNNNETQPFQCLSIDSATPARAFLVDFVIEPADLPPAAGERP